MQAEGFLLHYKQDEIESGVLWETHCHAHFELIAVLAGDVLVTTEGKEHRLTAGEAILIPPLCYHAVTAQRKCTYRRLTVAFDEAAIPEALRAQLFSCVPRPFRADAALTSRLCTLCEEKDVAFYAPLGAAVMLQLLYDGAASVRTLAEDALDPVLHRALTFMEAHLCEKLLLDDVAAELAVSKSFLCHSFQKKMRISPKQYILQKRMALADKLIREGVPPTQVAIRVGYENYSNFYRIYRKHLQK